MLAMLLAGVLLAGNLVACNNTEQGEGEQAGTGTPDVDVEAEAKLEVPAGIAEGKTFSMYFANPDVKNNYIAEEETGDDMNDAVYQRNQLVMEHTGVELEFVASSRTSNGADQQAETSLIRTLIQSGDDTYDAYVHVQHTGMPTLIEEGMFVDWKTIPHVKLDNPWWYSNVERDICFGDKVFCMTGDYNLSSFSGSECLIFNKTMLDEIGMEYPYQLVFDGTWTHDKFVEYIKAATSDLNGDGTLDYDNDRYGFGGWQYEQLQALFAGYGGEAITKDEYNLPVLNIDNELTYTIVDKMLEVFDNDGAFFEGKTYGIDDRMFNDGRLLFNDSFLSGVPGTRKLENIDVGFIPYPKLNEEQENYYSRTANISCLTYIPVTNTDLDKTGAVLETMAYYGNQIVLPTYFDIILTIKSTRDVESEEMIPIIRDSSRFLDQVIGFTGSNIVTAKNGNTLASFIASSQDSWNEKIESLIETYTGVSSDDEAAA